MLKCETIVAMPCLNEAGRAVQAITSLLADPASQECRFILLDGGSTDGTLDIVRSTFGDRVEIVHNAHRSQSHAINLAAQIGKEIGAKYMLRADLHAHYPVPFLSVLLHRIAESEASSVVVPMRTIGGNAVQNAAALVFNSWLGNGGSQHRSANAGGWVDHGHHALFRLEDFVTTGGYDTAFKANEDAEFDIRLTARAGRVYLEPGATIDYVPRGSVRGTYQQFFRNGRFRVWTSVKHDMGLALRQVIPMSILPVLVMAGLLAIIWLPALLVPIGYIILLFGLALASKAAAPVKATLSVLALSVQVAAASHIGFSAGALFALYELHITRKKTKIELRNRTHPPL